jgi:hypothetical protein
MPGGQGREQQHILRWAGAAEAGGGSMLKKKNGRVHGQVGTGCAAVSGIPAACHVSKTSGVLASVQLQR